MISFEWDEAKRRKNLHKHGIDFVDVVSVFDGFIVTIEDTSYSYDDVRFLTIGELKSHVVVVVHTETDEIIRIISARKATKNETLKYYKSIGN